MEEEKDSIEILLLKSQRDIARLTSENEALRAQLRAKDEMLMCLQSSILFQDLNQQPPSAPISKKESPPTRVVIPATNFDAGRVHFDHNDARAIAISYDKHALIIQTPVMSVPFGVNTWTTGPVCRRYVQLAMVAPPAIKTGKGHDMSFMDKLIEFDRRACEKAYGLLGGNCGIVHVPCIKHGAQLTIRVRIPEKSSDCLAFDSRRQRVADAEQCLSAGSEVVALIRCNGVWLTNERCGLSWTLVQVRQEKSPGLHEYAFLS